jgi:predicted phage tail component-like protein
MTFTVTYAGAELTDFFTVTKVNKSILPPREISLLEVPSRHGAYFTGARYGVRKIEYEVLVKSSTATELMDTIRLLAFCVDVAEPSELMDSDEPNKYYYAILSGDTPVDEMMDIGKGTLTFLCMDPFAYSAESKTTNPVGRKFNFVNEGTATTFPKFTVNFQNAATFVSFTSPDGTILIGNPSSPEQIVLPEKDLKLNDSMGSTTGWANAGAVLDSGRANAGAVTAINGSALGASSYGTGTAGAKTWHGPAIRKDLSETLKDFTVKARISFSSQDGTSTLDGDQKGRLEIYLFNASGGKIGKLVMRDSYSNYEFNIPEIYIGNTTFLEDQPDPAPGKKTKQKFYTNYFVKKGDTWTSIAKKYKMSASELASSNGMRTTDPLPVKTRLIINYKTTIKTVYPEHVGRWNDFFGEFSLSRVGDFWAAQVVKVDENGKQVQPIIVKSFRDKEGVFTTANLSYIVIHFSQYDTDVVVQKMHVTDLKVYKHNTDTVIDVPAIFQAGDELEVDLTDSSVWLNGEPFMQQVDVASTFFPLSEGTTEVKVNTNDTAATFTAEFTERFL